MGPSRKANRNFCVGSDFDRLGELPHDWPHSVAIPSQNTFWAVLLTMWFKLFYFLKDSLNKQKSQPNCTAILDSSSDCPIGTKRGR